LEIYDFLMNFGSNLIRLLAVIAGLLAIIFVHELGHYLVGRWCGIGATVFSIGFGSQLLAFTDKRGTRWRLAAIPLGGYVKFIGDEDIASSKMKQVAGGALPAGAFFAASPWARAATVFAGPLFNFFYSLVVFSLFFFLVGRALFAPVIGSVLENSPAQAAGFQAGDVIVTMQGQVVDDFSEVRAYISMHGEEEVAFTVERDGRDLSLNVVPRLVLVNDGFDNMIRVGQIGVTLSDAPQHRRLADYNLFEAVGEAFNQAGRIMALTGSFLGRALMGRADRCQLSGPIRSGQIAWRVSDMGFLALLQLTAIFSLSIGLLNLLPLPPLDGGQLVFTLIEAVAGKPVPARIRDMILRIGMVLVLGLMIFAVVNNMIPC